LGTAGFGRRGVRERAKVVIGVVEIVVVDV
jgi:hypothetical protein